MREHGDDVTLFVQHGSSRPAAMGENAELVSHEEMRRRYREATVVVTQGGPGGILDAEEAGLTPIVMPRRPDLGEHVDGHQISFTRFMARAGEIVLAEDEATLHAALTAAIADPASVRRTPRAAPVESTADALEKVVLDVMSRPVGFIRWSRLRRQAHAQAS
jgi:UDP-N-acetylglucosamine transferase subunit ALG13